MIIERGIAFQPVFSEVFDLALNIPTFSHGTVIYRVTSEERTNAVTSYLNLEAMQIISVVNETPESFECRIGEESFAIRIAMESEINGFLDLLSGQQPLYIDVTGLLHSTWAVLLKAALNKQFSVKVLYAEPQTYKIRNNTNTYDLSRQIMPVKPIPGFAVLTSPGSYDFIFIPLLGFERRRLELILTDVDPPKNATYPIVGMPGFKIHFPFETYIVNKKALLENELYQNVRYAAASCPFRLYYRLMDIAVSTRATLIKIALIGTKPHALGAILFYLFSGLKVELLYDHPERKEGRTLGMSKLHVFHIDSFSQSLNLQVEK